MWTQNLPIICLSRNVASCNTITAKSEYMWMLLDNKDFSVGGAARVIETKKKFSLTAVSANLLH